MQVPYVGESYSFVENGYLRGNQNIVSSGGYCEREYVVACGCQSYGVGVLGLECERASIYDYVDYHDLVRYQWCCPVRLCVLVAVVLDTVRVE
jgi:hypothetical protein